MRVLLPSIALAAVLCLLPAAVSSAAETTNTQIAEYHVTFDLTAAGESVGHGEMNFGPGGPTDGWATNLGQLLSTDYNPAEIPELLILAGIAGTEYEKPRDLSIQYWTGFWHSAAEFTLGELEFFIYSARADRVLISATRQLHAGNDSGADTAEVTGAEFYGELEAPLSCPPLQPQSYMCRIDGFSAGELVRQAQFGLVDAPANSVYQVCGPEDEAEGSAAMPSCLLIILPAARHDHLLDWHVDQALGGLPQPPLDTLKLGPFELNYYYPESDRLTFSLWKLDGEWREDWEADTPLACRVTLANSQPPPVE